MAHTVKRKGHTEEFDTKKVYASVFAACMCLRMTDQQGELLADTVSKEVGVVLKDSSQVSAEDIHKAVVSVLTRYNPDVAFLYDTHRDIS